MSKSCVFLFVISESLINLYLTIKNDTYIDCDGKIFFFFYIIMKKYSKLFLLFIDISRTQVI